MSQTTGRISAGDIVLVVFVTVIWGFNFVVIAVGVRDVPPLLLACLRFVLAAVPAAFFIRRPKASMLKIASYGLVLGVGEFGLLFCAIKLGASSGLSSLVLQSQAFFTALLAALFLKETLRVRHGIGMILAFAGIGLLVYLKAAGTQALTMPLPALVMILLAALMWAIANILAKNMGGINALGLMVWSSLFSPLPLFLLSLALEGPQAIGAAVQGMSLLSIGSIAYLAFVSTLLGYGLWNYLIVKNGASAIAPFSLLVPVSGVFFSALLLGEQFSLGSLLAAGLIFSGLVVHVLGHKLVRRPKL